MIAVGINRDRHREVLGIMVGDTESEASGSKFVSRLKIRGLVRAIRQYSYGVTWQRFSMKRYQGLPPFTYQSACTDLFDIVSFE